MENLSETKPDSNNLELESNALNHLKETRMWANLLAIVGFVFLGLMLLIMVIAFSASGFRMLGKFEMLAFIPMILVMVAYFFPFYYLLMFSRYSKQAIMNSDTSLMTLAFKYLKLHYRFMGILLIVFLSIYVIVILIMLSVGSLFNSFV
jgi:hypothetical protein